MDNSNFTSLEDIVAFQISRQLINFTKNTLLILEKHKDYAAQLEKTLSEMGVAEYNDSDKNFKEARKAIFDWAGNTTRELTTLINKFDFKFKN